MRKSLYSALCVSIIVSACSAEKANLKSRTNYCQELYSEAESKFNEEDYFESQETLNEVLNTCTGTGVIEDAQYMMAESYFNMENWIEARAEYELFASQFPNSPHTPSAMFKKGVSAYNIDYVPGRDGSYTEKGINDFKDFLIQYPGSAMADSAQFYRNSLIERLAEADMAIAKLYLKLGKPLATAIYLKDFIQKFPESKLKIPALLLLIECYTRIDQFNQALQYIEYTKELELSADEKSQYDSAVNEYNSKYASYSNKLKEEKQKKQESKVEF